jgi:hypothetical protein
MSFETVVTDYPGFQRALRARAEELGISRARLNEIAGTSEGHAEKILSETPGKNLGITTFGDFVQALALELVVRESPEQFRKLSKRFVRRDERHVRRRRRPRHRSALNELAAALGRKGAMARNKSLSAEERSAAGRKAVLARWRKVREAQEGDPCQPTK